MEELSIDSVMGSLVNYGGDPMLIETEEQPDALKIARLMREMGDWLSENHNDILF